MKRKEKFYREAERLKEFILEEKPHMNASFLKEDLCEELNMSVTQLHKMLTRFYGVSYSQLMNMLRVKEARKLLADAKNRNRKKHEIAEMSGFTSLSQFNVQFKLLTGMTPTEYEIFYHQFKNMTGESPDNYIPKNLPDLISG